MSEASVTYLDLTPENVRPLAVRERGDIKAGTVVVTMYGGVLMFRGWCVDCRKNAFITDGRLVCCNERYEATRIRQERIATKSDGRSGQSETQRQALVDAQGGLCFYCGRAFWSEVYRSGKSIVLRPHVDHFVPFAYCQSEKGTNKVAVCHICNGLKNATVFLDTDIAREWLELRWRKKGYRDAAIFADRGA